MRRILFFSFFLLLAITGCLHAQTDPLVSRPKLGLSLSGGGARGMAHIGVLQVMEEAGLYPDYITGVSMGSIVGGLYAMGYSADSLAAIFRSRDWNRLLLDMVDERSIVYEEKKYYNNHQLRLAISKERVKLPDGLIPGQQISRMLNRYMYPVADVHDFTRLPIPFSCVAADIITCRQVTLSGGYLPKAVRGSMTVPSAFSPVPWGDTALLIDGGLVRNFAVNEVLNMGADIIVGSYTGRRLLGREEMNSVGAILSQMGSFTGLYDAEEQKKKVDILVSPETKNIGMADFTRVDTIIKSGYHAALPYKESFGRLAARLDSLAPAAPRPAYPEKRLQVFDSIAIEGNRIFPDDEIRGILDLPTGEPIPFELLDQRLTLLYGKMYFEKVTFSTRTYQGNHILVIECLEKPQTLGELSANYSNYLGAGIFATITTRDLLNRRSRIMLEGLVAEKYRYRLSWLQYLHEKQKWSVYLSYYSNKDLLPSIRINREVRTVNTRNHIWTAQLQRSLKLNQLVKTGLEMERLGYLPRFAQNDTIKRFNIRNLNLFMGYELNTFDNKHNPTRGARITFNSEYLNFINAKHVSDSASVVYDKETPGAYAFDPYLNFMLLSDFYIPVTNAVSINLSSNIVVTGDTNYLYNDFMLAGGPESIHRRSIPLYGFHANEITAKNMVSFGGGLKITFKQGFSISYLANVAAVQRIGNDMESYTLFYGDAINLILDTFIGPMKIGLMHGNSADKNFFSNTKAYLSLGYRF